MKMSLQIVLFTLLRKSEECEILPSTLLSVLDFWKRSQQRQFKCHWFKMPFSDNFAFIIPTLIKLAFTVDSDTVISWPIVYA